MIFCVFLANRGESEASAKNSPKITPVLQANQKPRVYCHNIPWYQANDPIWLRYHAHLAVFGCDKYLIVHDRLSLMFFFLQRITCCRWRKLSNAITILLEAASQNMEIFLKKSCKLQSLYQELNHWKMSVQLFLKIFVTFNLHIEFYLIKLKGLPAFQQAFRILRTLCNFSDD